MNDAHKQFLASPDWARMLEEELLPWLEGVGELGDDVLEIGPGPGLTTDLLRERVPKVTAVELDPELADALSSRLAGTNVEVINGDGTDTGLAADRFSSATCFSVLHHVPSVGLQDGVFREVLRVLRPGGLLAAVDSVDDPGLRTFHEDDVFVPLDPEALPDRLRAIGFDDVEVGTEGYHLRFTARKER